MSSLSARLLLVVSVLLILFFGLTIIVLEVGFERSAEKAVEDRLEARVIMLLSAAITDDDTLRMPRDLPEPRFATPGSGVLGQIVTGPDELLWRSDSSVGVFVPDQSLGAPGERRFTQVSASDGERVFALSFGVAFEDLPPRDPPYTFTVSERTAPYDAQVSRFRRQLLTYFTALAVLLLAAQAAALRWVLRPLRQVADEIRDVEQGDRSTLSRGYPTELAGLTRNTNRLLDAERKRRARYRNTLGNLAHSLKTPLAVLRNALSLNASGSTEVDAPLMQQQIDRMNDIVGYQLQRAGASGGMTLGQDKIDLVPIVHDITGALGKVYASKDVALTVNAPESLRVLGDRGDAMEMFGNVLDNAFKWCAGAVAVELRAVPDASGGKLGFVFQVDDDGPGIDPAHRATVLSRGARVDESVAGQGIGLAVVRELVELSGGELVLTEADSGGARVRITL
ncbi:MAG: ATP-binding protein [Gammaproteobacteria bacterium]